MFHSVDSPDFVFKPPKNNPQGWLRLENRNEAMAVWNAVLQCYECSSFAKPLEFVSKEGQCWHVGAFIKSYLQGLSVRFIFSSCELNQNKLGGNISDFNSSPGACKPQLKLMCLRFNTLGLSKISTPLLGHDDRFQTNLSRVMEVRVIEHFPNLALSALRGDRSLAATNAAKAARISGRSSFSTPARKMHVPAPQLFKG